MTIPKDNTQLENARRLRREMTPHERKLWYLFLRRYPVKIYKQRIIGRFIVDFSVLRPDWSLNWMALSIMNLRGLLMMRNVLNF
mgnify:CR=1 FL=1